MFQVTVPFVSTNNFQTSLPPAFAGVPLPICILLHESFLNVGSVGQLQKASGL